MSVIKCSHCGKELPVESNFCPYCMEQINKPVEVNIPKGKKKISKERLIMVSITLLLSVITVGLLISRYYNIPISEKDIKISDTTEDSNKTQGLQIFKDTEETEGENRPEDGNATEYEIKSEKTTLSDRNINIVADMNEGTDTPVNRYPVEGTTQKDNSISSVGNTSQGNFTDNKEEKTTHSGNNSGSVAETQTKECKHNWIAQTKIVHHEEVGHYEEVSKQRPVKIYRCDVCSEEYDSINKYYNHFDNTHTPMYDGDPITIFREEYTTDTEYEYYTETQWVLDEDAYDETVITGYLCSYCGKSKEN